MYLLLFCMHVQTTPVVQKPPKTQSTTSKRTCFRIEPQFRTFEIRPKIVKDDCKPVLKAFKKLSALVIKNATIGDCQENKEMKCKKCYCVCCNVHTNSVRIHKIPDP